MKCQKILKIYSVLIIISLPSNPFEVVASADLCFHISLFLTIMKTQISIITEETNEREAENHQNFTTAFYGLGWALRWFWSLLNKTELFH